MENFFQIDDISDFQQKALHWSVEYTHVSYFNNCHIDFPYNGFSNLLFVGANKIIDFLPGKSFENLADTFLKNKTWLTGYFSYDLKNEVEKLKSKNSDKLFFKNIYFYQPQIVIIFEKQGIKILSETKSPEKIYAQILKTKIPIATKNQIKLQCKVSLEKYIETVERIKKNIIEGDVYELNYCIEFFKKNVKIFPEELYFKIIEKSPSPFSIFQKTDDLFLLSASPERFLKKENFKLISQPIKGTAKRFNNIIEDLNSKHTLSSSEKEKAENLMIVDLVRNDLSKSSMPGSVFVEELFGIYSFSHVHQMISTISSTISNATNFATAILNAFPMGSMTGAPKIKAMQLIDNYENSRRSLYSGSVGYIQPNGDFDFNVVIRSILYNKTHQYLSLQVGSAITYDSIPEKEYEECLLKGKALMDTLEGNT